MKREVKLVKSWEVDFRAKELAWQAALDAKLERELKNDLPFESLYVWKAATSEIKPEEAVTPAPLKRDLWVEVFAFVSGLLVALAVGTAMAGVFHLAAQMWKGMQ